MHEGNATGVGPRERFARVADDMTRDLGMPSPELDERRRELADHLADAYDASRVAGESEKVAVDHAIERFGSVEEYRRALRGTFRRQDRRDAANLSELASTLLLADVTLATVWTVHATDATSLDPAAYLTLTAGFSTLGALGYFACVFGWRYGLRLSRRAWRARSSSLDLLTGGALLLVTPPVWLFFGAGASARMIGAPLERIPAWRAACDAALDVARAIIAFVA